MKKLCMIFALSIVLTGVAVGIMSSFCQAQVYAPAPLVSVTVGSPWAGPNTPWVFYNGDWFSQGVLHYYFGPKYGWAPYYAYPRACVVRPAQWYGPKWHAWYAAHPACWQHFHQHYPYWRSHQVGHHYDEAFYNRYHRGQGHGWHG